jgi:excisionase family DNA binding protein
MDVLLNVKQAAEALNLSEWTIRHLLKTKQIAKIKVGTRVLIESDEIQRFIESHKQ